MTGRWMIVILEIVLVGCGGLLPSPTTGPSEAPTEAPTTSPTTHPPTGATDVLLRMLSGGGLPWYIGPTYIRPPEFTLYGDGRVIYLVVSGEPPQLMQARLNEEQVATLLEYALGEGGLARARAEYDEPGIFDVGTTRFMVNAGDIHKSGKVGVIK